MRGYTKEQNERFQQVASTILSQLGGNKFVIMTGAKQIVFDSGKDEQGAIQFKIGRNSSKANIVKIELRGDDTYTMKFFQYRKMELKELKAYEGIYCDQLRSIFTDYTGLFTSLY